VLFATLTPKMTARARAAIAVRATVIASLILLIFTFLGQPVLDQLGVTIPALQTAGGIILRSQRLNEERFRQTRHTDQKGMAAGQDRHQRTLDHEILAEDNGGGRFVCALHALCRRLKAGHNIGVGLGDCTHDGHGSLVSLGERRSGEHKNQRLRPRYAGSSECYVSTWVGHRIHRKLKDMPSNSGVRPGSR